MLLALTLLLATTVPDASGTLDLPKCSDAWLLVRFDYQRLSGSHELLCEVCGKVDDSLCELDWPTSDVATCETFDTLRNTIYASYGRSFKAAKWRALFKQLPWYKENERYDDALLSPVAKRNVDKLKALRDDWAKRTKDDASCRP